jgi:hypothetical protein
VTLKEILEKDKSQVLAYRQYVINCFNSEDPSIKNRALEIIKVTVCQSYNPKLLIRLPRITLRHW